jgi:glucose-1-phosphate cytidylyltransferase
MGNRAIRRKEDAVKAVILAGGLGTRLAEETGARPKPLVEIGGMPILWHIMKMYSAHGIDDFVICAGYKGHQIKEFFSGYFMRTSDVTFDLSSNEMQVHARHSEPWRVTVVDTGESTQTGGRIKRIREHVQGGPFCLTYGDGVSDVDIAATLAFHRGHGRLVTVTAIQPPSRFGTLGIQDGVVHDFCEKPVDQGGWINGGFFVVDPDAIDVIDGERTVWEREPLEKLVRDGQLMAYRHRGFWQPMDTVRDRQALQALWDSGQAPWKVW